MTPLWALRVGIGIGLVAMVVLLIDALLRARDAWNRRRMAQGGVYGVVIDRTGATLGTYVDPTQPPRRATFVHGPGSVWTGSDPSDPTAWAWEGQGATEMEARFAAYRLRQLYLSLLPELSAGIYPDDEGVGNRSWS